MALFKSQVFTQASGSVGGLTYTRTRSGMVIRARSMPVNPNTPLQQERRLNLGSLSAGWRSLTEELRQEWADYASNTPVRNKLGDEIYLTAQQSYVKQQAARRAAGLTDLANPPVAGGVPPAPAGLTFAYDQPNEEFDLTWDAWTTPDGPDSLAIYISTPKRPTIHFYKGPFRLFAVPDSTPGTITILPPDGIAVGDAIFIRVVALHQHFGAAEPIILRSIYTGPPTP